MLMYAYRLVEGDRVARMPTVIKKVEGRNTDTVTVEFTNGFTTTYEADSVLNISARSAPRPKYKPEHKMGS
jgi:hypothetical protein